MNIVALLLLVPLLGLSIWRAGVLNLINMGGFIGLILSVVCMIPHEFLHAIWFKGNVYMYQNLGEGMLFVVGDGRFYKGAIYLDELFS